MTRESTPPIAHLAVRPDWLALNQEDIIDPVLEALLRAAGGR